MRTTFLSLALLTLLIFGCKPTAKYTDFSANAKLDDALLWKIEGKNLAKASYLFGTIHMIDANDFFLPEGTTEAIDATSKMVFEIDMKEMSDMGALMGMMNKLYMNDGKKLSDLISKEDFDLVNTHFTKMGLPMMFFEKMKPMFLTVFAMDIDPSGLKNGSIKSYEMEFAKIAKEKNMDTDGLESIDFQISIFDKIPYEDQAKMLVDALKDKKKGSAEFERMVQLYKKQKISELLNDMMKNDSGYKDHEDVLVDGRNKSWIPEMKRMMGEAPTFFAVGAGHLPGTNGVIKLLRKEGYIVSPVLKL